MIEYNRDYARVVELNAGKLARSGSAGSVQTDIIAIVWNGKSAAWPRKKVVLGSIGRRCYVSAEHNQMPPGLTPAADQQIPMPPQGRPPPLTAQLRGQAASPRSLEVLIGLAVLVVAHQNLLASRQVAKCVTMPSTWGIAWAS